jgi:hypothetical protein
MNPLMVVLAVLLALFLFGMLPIMPWYGDWGYYPSGGAFLVLVILLIILLVGPGRHGRV